MITLELIQSAAQAAHEANRAYCQYLGDLSQEHWENAPLWQQESSCYGVDAIISGKVETPEQSHENWLKLKLDEGWVYGPVKDPEKKEHPCMVPFNELPADQQLKDRLFFAIVTTMIRR